MYATLRRCLLEAPHAAAASSTSPGTRHPRRLLPAPAYSANMRGTLRSALIVTAAVLLSMGGAALPSVASHTVSACGRVLDFAGPVGTDATSGLGRLRIAVATGEQSYLFLYRDASNAPLLIEPGATQIGAFVCMGGTHVESASSVRSDYVTIHRLVLAVPTSMPATSTAPEQRDFGATITIAGLLAALFAVLSRGRSARASSSRTR